jgi:hypothetical protein
MNFVYGNLIFDITSTLFAANSENDVRARLFEITGAHYTSMTYPYGLLKKAEQNFENYTLKHAFWGFKYTESALKAMRDHQGFRMYLEDYENEKIGFNNLTDEIKAWAKQICTFSQMKHGYHVDYTDFMYWQNKTPGKNGKTQKLRIQKFHKNLSKIWQNYFENYNEINEILSKPNDTTGALHRELLPYTENVLAEKHNIFILLFTNEKKAAATFKNADGLFIKTENKSWKKFDTYAGFGLTNPTFVIKIKFDTSTIIFK